MTCLVRQVTDLLLPDIVSYPPWAVRQSFLLYPDHYDIGGAILQCSQNEMASKVSHSNCSVLKEHNNVQCLWAFWWGLLVCDFWKFNDYFLSKLVAATKWRHFLQTQDCLCISLWVGKVNPMNQLMTFACVENLFTQTTSNHNFFSFFFWMRLQGSQ